jgi:hypothetical protein
VVKVLLSAHEVSRLHSAKIKGVLSIAPNSLRYGLKIFMFETKENINSLTQVIPSLLFI